MVPAMVVPLDVVKMSDFDKVLQRISYTKSSKRPINLNGSALRENSANPFE
jgi:hypothetical protein